MTDWKQIREAYVCTDLSCAELARIYNVKETTLSSRIYRGKWHKMREERRMQLARDLVGSIRSQEIRKLHRVGTLTDRLLDQVEKAISELDKREFATTCREKTMEYENEVRPDKPTREVLEESERVRVEQSLVDREGIKRLASALKDLRDVQIYRDEHDVEEQLAKIEQLRHNLESEPEGGPLEVVFSAGDEEFNT